MLSRGIVSLFSPYKNRAIIGIEVRKEKIVWQIRSSGEVNNVTAYAGDCFVRLGLQLEPKHIKLDICKSIKVSRYLIGRPTVYYTTEEEQNSPTLNAKGGHQTAKCRAML